MSSQRNEPGGIGCAMLALFAYIIGIVIQAIPQIIALIKSLIPIALIIAGVYIVYLIFQFEKDTDKISNFFSRFSSKKPRSDLVIEEDNNENVIENKLDWLAEKLEKFKSESKDYITSLLSRKVKEIDLKNKSEVMIDVFGNDSSEYSRSDEYEKQKKIKKAKEREENLTNREWRQDMIEKIHAYKYEALEDRMALRQEMKDGLLYLENKCTSIQQFVVEKFYFLNSKIDTQIANVKTIIGDLRVELKQDLADFKVQVGREIVRMDKVMLSTIEKLEKYNSRVERFSYEVKKATLEAERNAVRGERMLTQAQALYTRHQSEVKVLSKDIEVAAQKIGLGKQDIANKISSAKLMLDRSAMEQINSMKEIAQEKMGVKLLRDDHLSRQRESQMKIQQLINENRHIEERLELKQNSYQKQNALQLQLHRNQENLQYERHRNGVLKQEFAIFKRLSK